MFALGTEVPDLGELCLLQDIDFTCVSPLRSQSCHIVTSAGAKTRFVAAPRLLSFEVCSVKGVGRFSGEVAVRGVDQAEGPGGWGAPGAG